MQKTNEILQWTGAGFIILGHSLNAVGPAVYPFNIIAFTIGTLAFLAWAKRVGNMPQITVNLVSITIGFAGLIKAYFG